MAGVYFMGESVKILNPNKTVLLVDLGADCPMAHMVSVEEIEKMRALYKDLCVVTYINSTAEIKAHSDVCVTSSNAVKIVSSLPEKTIFFVPDQNLGRYVKKQVQDKEIILNKGFCPIHHQGNKAALLALKAKHPNAPILAHPECPEEVLDLADYVGSTKGIIKAVGDYDTSAYLIVTEEGIRHELEKCYPLKTFYFLDNFICPDMKFLNLDKLEEVLKTGKNEVFVDEAVAKKALASLERMLLLGAN